MVPNEAFQDFKLKLSVFYFAIFEIPESKKLSVVTVPAECRAVTTPSLA